MTDDKPLNVVSIYDSNFRDPVATLRDIADQIDDGKFGEIGSIGIVLLGDTMEVFGAGIDAEAPSVAVLLHAGFMRLCKAIEELGK